MATKQNYERPYKSTLGRPSLGREFNRRFFVTHNQDSLNAQADVRSILPNVTAEVVANLRVKEKRTGYICFDCGYSSKKWVVDAKCRSRIDCLWRQDRPDGEEKPYYYDFGKNTPKFMMTKIEESIASINWTDQEITDQIEYMEERFGV